VQFQQRHKGGDGWCRGGEGGADESPSVRVMILALPAVRGCNHTLHGQECQKPEGNMVQANAHASLTLFETPYNMQSS